MNKTYKFDQEFTSEHCYEESEDEISESIGNKSYEEQENKETSINADKNEQEPLESNESQSEENKEASINADKNEQEPLESNESQSEENKETSINADKNEQEPLESNESQSEKNKETSINADKNEQEPLESNEGKNEKEPLGNALSIERNLAADFQYLIELNDPEKIVDDQNAYEIINYLRLKITTALKQNESPKVFALLHDIFIYLLEKDIDFEGVEFIDLSIFYKKSTSLKERECLIFYNILKIFNFALSLVDQRVYFQNKKVISAMLNVLNNLDKDYHEYNVCYSLLLFNMNWMSKEAENYKQIWNDVNTIEILLKVNEHFEKYAVTINMIIANVASDTEIEKHIFKIYSGCDKSLEIFVDCVNSKQIIKIEVADSDYKQKLFAVRAIFNKSIDAVTSIVAYLVQLYKLSVNNTIKQKIYYSKGFKDAIQALIYSPSCTDLEKHHGLQLLAQLAFDSRIKDDLLTNKQLFEFIQKQETREDFEFLKLKQSCKYFLWILKPYNDVVHISTRTITPDDQRHVMISYNSASRETCLKIKSALEKANHKVWIDVYEMNGKVFMDLYLTSFNFKIF